MQVFYQHSMDHKKSKYLNFQITPTTQMDYSKMDYATEVLLIRVKG